MKQTLLLLVLFCQMIAHAGVMPEPQVVKINPHVYALLGPLGRPSPHNQGYMVNSTVIIGENGVILIDSGGSDEVGGQLAKTIAKITPKPITHVINTHHHGDHHLGNIVFKGAEILGSEQCRILVEKTGDEWVTLMESLIGRKLPNTRPISPGITFPDKSHSTRKIEGIKLIFWVPPGAHTPGDMMIYLPDDKVLISGDILVNTIVPNLRDANIKNWIGVLEKIQEWDITTIIPGHGPLMTQTDVAKWHKRLTDFYTGVEAGYKKGLSDSEIRSTLGLSEWQKMKEFDSTMGANINRAYLEIEAANF